MEYFIWIGLFAPLAGFLSLVASSFVVPRLGAGLIACFTILLSFTCFCILLFNNTYNTDQLKNFYLYTLIPIQSIQANFSIHLDHLSMLMCLIVTGVGFLIHVYSIGYMEHDRDIARYFAFLNFFVFAMLLLVL